MIESGSLSSVKEFKHLMGGHILHNKKILAVAIVVVVAVLGAVVYAAGKKDNKTVATKPVTQVQQPKTETSSANTDQSTDGQTLGESTSSDGEAYSEITSTSSSTSRPAPVARVASVITPPVTTPVTPPTQPQGTTTENQGGNTNTDNTGSTDNTDDGSVVTDPVEDVHTVDLCSVSAEAAPIQIPVNAILEGELQTCEDIVISWQFIYKNMFWEGDVPESILASAYMIMNPEDKVSSKLRFVIAPNDNPEYAAVPGDTLEFALYMPELDQVHSFKVTFIEAVDL